MEMKRSASKGGLVTCGIFLACYVLFNFILVKLVHNHYYQIFVYIVLGIAGLIISKEELKEAGALWKKHPVRNALFLLGGLILKIVIDNIAAIPYALLFPDYTSMNNSNLESALKTLNPVLIVAALGIFGPITEETVFRTILTKRAGEFVPKAVAVIVSSLLFGVIHMHALNLAELLSVLPQVLFGVLMAILLLKTKNVTLVYIIHVLNNLLPLVMVILSR